MSEFQPGDSVSFLNEKMNGIVRSVSPKGLIRVIRNDGFEYDVAPRDLIKISSGETTRKTSKVTGASPVAATDGNFYLAFINSQDTASMYVINNSAALGLFLLFRCYEGRQKLEAHGTLKPQSALEVLSFPISEAEKWKSWHIQIIQAIERTGGYLPPIDSDIKYRPLNLINASDFIPVIQKQGLCLRINAENEQKQEQPVSSGKQTEGLEVPDIVDLHIENIVDTHRGLSAASVLQMQEEHFRNSLEKAVAAGKDRIIFIHGLGSGKLKNSIRSYLTDYPETDRFEDANPKIFGYGATAVYLKIR
jgi:hypothetical protein